MVVDDDAADNKVSANGELDNRASNDDEGADNGCADDEATDDEAADDEAANRPLVRCIFDGAISPKVNATIA
jgi:hypothetical protein